MNTLSISLVCQYSLSKHQKSKLFFFAKRNGKMIDSFIFCIKLIKLFKINFISPNPLLFEIWSGNYLLLDSVVCVVTIVGFVYHEKCYCPETDVKQWLQDMNCPNVYRYVCSMDRDSILNCSNANWFLFVKCSTIVNCLCPSNFYFVLKKRKKNW